jgi:hypothetical protein
VNDYGKPQNDKTQQDEHARELIEQLNLLEAVDRRITPEHIARRFCELLDDIGDDCPPGGGPGGHPPMILNQPGLDSQLAGLVQKSIESCADRAGFSTSLDAAIAAAHGAAADIIASAQAKAKAAADELRHAHEAVTAARQQTEQIVAEAQAEADKALAQAAKMVRDARDQAERIVSEARDQAAQTITAARNEHAHQNTLAWDTGALNSLAAPANLTIADTSFAESCMKAAIRLPHESIVTWLTDLGRETDARGRSSTAAAKAAGLTPIGVPREPDDLDDLHTTVGAHTGLGPDSPLSAEIVGVAVAAAAAAMLIERPSFGGSPPRGGTKLQRPGQGAQRDIAAVQAGWRQAAAPALPADGQMCALFAVDIVGFTRPDRDDDTRRYLHEKLYEYLQIAFDSSGVPWQGCYSEDRGDGALIVVPPGISFKSLIYPLPERLRRLIRRHNHVSRESAAIQLRAAVHIGPVEYDGHGFIGTDVSFAFRMLEARPVKRMLAASDAELCLAVSDYVYRSLVCRYPSLMHPNTFQAVRFQVKNTRARAWTYLPGAEPLSRAPDEDGANLRPSPRTADSKLKTPLDTPEAQADLAEEQDDQHVLAASR